MKANEAPEKIYIVNDDLNIKREWYKTKQVGFDTTEYTRTDAIIENAIGWIDYNNRNGGCNFDGWEKDFINYMKGDG